GSPVKRSKPCVGHGGTRVLCLCLKIYLPLNSLSTPLQNSKLSRCNQSGEMTVKQIRHFPTAKQHAKFHVPFHCCVRKICARDKCGQAIRNGALGMNRGIGN